MRRERFRDVGGEPLRERVDVRDDRYDRVAEADRVHERTQVVRDLSHLREMERRADAKRDDPTRALRAERSHDLRDALRGTRDRHLQRAVVVRDDDVSRSSRRGDDGVDRRRVHAEDRGHRALRAELRRETATLGDEP